MKYEDFWSIYFTIWRIFLIFYLTHSCICLLNYHHLYYLSETAIFLPMFLLLILNYCCSDVIIVEASDEFGYRVWFLVYRVWCFHPSSWTGSLPASCQCQHPARLCYHQHLGFFPVGCCSSCGSLQVLVCCRGIPSVEARRSSIIVIATVITTVCRGSLMVVSRRYEIWWWLMSLHSWMSVWILSWFPPIANLSGLSIYRCQYVSWLVKSFSPIYEIKWSSNITIKKNKIIIFL